MPWLQLRINTPPEQAGALESALQHGGALAVTMEDNADQPIFEPALGETPLWHETRVTALYNADINTHSTIEQLRKALPEKTRPLLEKPVWHILEDKDWEREWMTNYHPMQCGDNFWICPSWTEPPCPEAVNLHLDPGLAFGTGTHPTTFLCVSWLARQNLGDLSVIDYGCGSGILGLACLLLGARKVTGVDIDPQALLATQENARRNGLESSRFPVCFPDRCPADEVDLVIANILAGPLVELAPTLGALIKPGGRICLSGIIDSQVSAVKQAYNDSIEILSIDSKEEWVCITGVKKQHHQ